jgi:hypothetical protein
MVPHGVAAFSIFFTPALAFSEEEFCYVRDFLKHYPFCSSSMLSQAKPEVPVFGSEQLDEKQLRMIGVLND